MNPEHQIKGSRDKPLFTPGPLTTSRMVKQAMLRDLGARDSEFIALVKDIRRRLLALGGVAGCVLGKTMCPLKWGKGQFRDRGTKLSPRNCLMKMSPGVGVLARRSNRATK